jgi:GNAT superfamily N-acetyltransferase
MPTQDDNLDHPPDSSPAIRTARRTDAPAIARMIDLLAAYHGDVATADIAALERDVFGERPWVSVLVAEIAEELIAYAVLCPLYTAQYGQRGMDLHHLFVVPAWRSRGLGRRMVHAALDYARAQSCSAVTVGADAGNVAAQDFYQRLGFVRLPAPGPRFRVSLGPAR